VGGSLCFVVQKTPAKLTVEFRAEFNFQEFLSRPTSQEIGAEEPPRNDLFSVE